MNAKTEDITSINILYLADSYKMFMRMASGLRVSSSEAAEKMCVSSILNMKYSQKITT